MKKIITIYEKDVYPEKELLENIDYTDRATGKAIIIDDENMIALVGNKQNDFLQLPGGGIDSDENIEDGVIRECLEETGCVVSILDEVGCIDDYRSRDKKHCINYCYTVKALDKNGKLEHTEDEAGIGMYTKWVSVEEVLNIFKKQKKELEEGKITFYNTGFNIMRDFLFLEESISSNKVRLSVI